MTFDPAHSALLRGQALGGFFGNLALNGAMAWLLWPPIESLPLWARGNCVGGDTIGTSFFMSLITCLVITPITRKSKAPILDRKDLPAAVRWLPGNMVGRGATVGLIAALTVALVTLFALTFAGVTAMTRGEVTLFKAIYTAVLGTVLTHALGLRALADSR